MKNLVKNLLLFVALLSVISMFTGCPQNAANTNENTVGQDSSKDDKTTKDDGYPPPPKAIAEADFELIDGSKFNLKDNKGKVVLLNLWAVWCGPCIKEMPHLNEMQEKYKDQGFVIVGLNTGNDDGDRETKENIEKFVEQQKLVYKIGWTERNITEEFFKLGQMSAIPQSFLINRDGKLIGIFQGGSAKVVVQMKEIVAKEVEAK